MSQTSLDLFDDPIAGSAAARKDGRLRKIGYAARPGTGPKGQRCNTCRFCIAVAQAGQAVRKCEVMADKWTTGPETNIKHNAPACAEWRRKERNFPS